MPLFYITLEDLRVHCFFFQAGIILMCYSGDWRVNESPPSLQPPVPHPNPIMCLVDSERRGLKLPTGHPFSQPSPRPPGQMGACLLSLGHKIQSGTVSAGLPDLCASWEEGEEAETIHCLIGCIFVALGAPAHSWGRKFSLIFKIRCHSWEQRAELIRLIGRPRIVLIEPLSSSC